MSGPAAVAALPTRVDPRGTEPLHRLFDGVDRAVASARGGLPDDLAQHYDGDLWIPLRETRPTVVANFVETLDGVVAMGADGTTGGGEVSGFSPTDRFVMGLLRAMADVVLVGAATVRNSPRAAWTPDGVFPGAGKSFASLRSSLGLEAVPTTLIATSSGDLDPGLPVFEERTSPIVIAAPPRGVERLRRQRFSANVAIEPIAQEDPLAMTDLIGLAGRLGARVVVSEAGPHLAASLVAAGRIDELFITLAPQLAGRGGGAHRLGMIEGTALWPVQPRWGHLASARRAGDHLFLRYQFEEST